ncbi:MAG: RNHCP domain-containing protein [Patescibacteria group bacterium]
MNIESKNQSFSCENCGAAVSGPGEISTKHRNHCPVCLFSKHVDLNISGDRQAKCGALMKPIGLTFKQEGQDKYGKVRTGELMLVHECVGCGRVSINRIAADDDPESILAVFDQSLDLSIRKKDDLQKMGIRILTESDKAEVKKQLFGKY